MQTKRTTFSGEQMSCSFVKSMVMPIMRGREKRHIILKP